MSGFVFCEQCQEQHFGEHGAVGLLVHHDGMVLLQRRSAYVDHPGTWSTPGGARHAGESAAAAMKREVMEEVIGLDWMGVEVESVLVDDHGAWSYSTFIANGSRRPRAGVYPRNRESTRLEWVPVGEVPDLPLHPGMARTWPKIAGAAGWPISETASPAPLRHRRRVRGWRMSFLTPALPGDEPAHFLPAFEQRGTAAARDRFHGSEWDARCMKDPSHEAPVPDCTCGIYAVESLSDLCRNDQVRAGFQDGRKVARQITAALVLAEMVIFRLEVFDALPVRKSVDPVGTWRGARARVVGPIFTDYNYPRIRAQWGVRVLPWSYMDGFLESEQRIVAAQARARGRREGVS